MFNRSTNAPATTYTPDSRGLYVATLDCTQPDPYFHPPTTRHLLHRLIGHETQHDGTTRMVVLPLGGAPRVLDPGEPHRVLTDAEAKAFDLAAWKHDERQAQRDQRAAAAARDRRQSARNELQHGLILSIGPTTMNLDGKVIKVNEEAHRIAADLIADGLARFLDDGYLVTTKPTEVSLSDWPYLGVSGSALFTPATRGARILTHSTPCVALGQPGYPPVVASGRFLVIGHVSRDGDQWTAYLGLTPWGTYQVELVGPGCPGTWNEDTNGVNAQDWVDTQRETDRQVQAAETLLNLQAEIRARLLTSYAYTPRGELEEAACRELVGTGFAYMVEGSCVLASPR